MQDQIRERAYYYYINGSPGSVKDNWYLAEMIQPIAEFISVTNNYSSDFDILTRMHEEELESEINQVHLFERRCEVDSSNKGKKKVRFQD